MAYRSGMAMAYPYDGQNTLKLLLHDDAITMTSTISYKNSSPRKSEAGKYYSVRKYFIHIAEMWCSGVSVKLIMSTKGATIKTKKLSKKFSFSLASPFDLDEKSLCEKYDLALKKPEFDYKLTKEERKKQLNAARLNDPGLKYRSQMFFGLNEVTKSIEKNLVAVVIFNQSLPKIMTKHIKPLCASRNASVLCIQSFNERFSVLLNLRKGFQDESIREAQIKMWYKCFKEGRESVESNLCSGRPSTSRTPENVERVRDAINEDRRLTVRELEENLEIPRTSVSEILMEDLGMRHVAAKFVPWFPLQEQKAFRAEIAEDLLQTTNNDPHFLKQVITGDESWVYSYDPEIFYDISETCEHNDPFIKCAADEESIFHDFIDMLKTLAPEPCDELKLLINEAQSVSTESSKPDSKSDSVKVLDTRKKKAVKKPVINWDSMYVLKKDFKNPFETENKKIDNFIDLSKFSDDCNPEVALEQNYFRSGSIQKKVEKSEDIYRKLNVAKKIARTGPLLSKGLPSRSPVLSIDSSVHPIPVKLSNIIHPLSLWFSPFSSSPICYPNCGFSGPSIVCSTGQVNPRNFLKDTFICRSLSPIIVSLGLYRGNSRFLIKSHSFPPYEKHPNIQISIYLDYLSGAIQKLRNAGRGGEVSAPALLGGGSF
ncbi:Protein GVQW3 [Nymphon striatum]|nr:Protein GVQW3 [Nymphon striatum]